MTMSIIIPQRPNGCLIPTSLPLACLVANQYSTLQIAGTDVGCSQINFYMANILQRSENNFMFYIFRKSLTQTLEHV